MIRILVADDHAIVREGLKELLAATPGLSVSGEARNAREVLASTRELDLDVVVLDLSMPGSDGIDLIRDVHAGKPQLPILVLSMHHEERYAVRAIRAGAAGYLTKNSLPEELIAAIRKVASGGAFITEPVAHQLSAPLPMAPPHTTLSDREYQIFSQLVQGRSVSSIAADLELSVKTVSTHKTHILEKLGLTNRTELVFYAIRHGLVDDPRSKDR